MSRLKLGDVEWGLFKIGDLFEIENGKCSKVSELKNGHVPYVGATNRNNGVLSFVENKSELLSKGNCLVFICDGEGSIGYSIYKNEDFVGTTTIKIGRNKSLNEYNGLFITTVADTVRGKYNFGYKRNEQHLKAETLQLPIDMFGNPNWQFMNDYIMQEQKILAQKIIDYYEQRCASLGNDLSELEEVQWQEFFIDDLFDIRSGVRLTKKNMLSGNTPFIGASDSNNGVTNFVSNNNKSLDSNVLGVNYNGSVVENFYHPYKCIFSDDVKRLKLKTIKGNQHLYLFLKTMILQQKGKYRYLYKFNATRMKRQKIMLPIAENGEPDLEYMSKFMQNLEKENIKKVLEYMYGYIY